MSDLFGVFCTAGQLASSDLLEAWRPLLTAKADWHGAIHSFPNLHIAAPETALAADEEAVVAFCGELRNHAELAREANLPETCAAAQLLLALLKRHSFGQLLQELNGPFALAYCDLKRRELHLVRDHLGQSFLFHTTLAKPGCVLFSDSLPRLTALPQVERQVDMTALADYLSLGYIPAPRTAYQKIAKVAPGTDDILDAQCHLQPRRYWLPTFLPQLQISWNEAVEEARRLLEQATRRLLAAHPDADFMLSGGIDSGTVMGIATKIAPDASRQAHCIAFQEAAYNESDLAFGTARRCGVPLQLHRLAPRDLTALDALLAESGEPYADSSLLPTAAATRATAKPALFTGDGGDEIFGGYRRYQAMLLRNRLPHWLQTLARPFCRAGAALLPNPRDNRSRLANLVRSLRSMSLRPMAAYGSFQQLANREWRNQLMARPSPQDYLEEWQDLAAQVPAADSVQCYNALDLMVYLPDDGFRKTNLAAANTGVSYLCPILDMEVVRFALALPVDFRFNAKENKRLLREIGRETLDPRILSQPKRGFGTPVADWFRNELKDMIWELAQGQPQWDKLQLLDYKQVIKTVKEHVQGQASHGALLWALYCLRCWERQL